MITDPLNNSVVEAAIDFVCNVENGLIEGAKEMPLRCDESFRMLRNAVNCLPASVRLDGDAAPLTPNKRHCPKDIFDALRHLLMTHEAQFIDWDRYSGGPDHDPNYRPEFPSICGEVGRLLKTLTPV